MKLPSREAILLYIRDKKEVTVAELSRKFQLTPANIRYHVKKLQEDGLVTVTTPEPWKRRRGRPELVIQLASRSRPDSLPQLVHALLSAAGEIQDPVVAAAFSSAVRQHLFPGPARGGSLTTRINRLVASFNHLNYQARWEVHAAGPRIIFANCPFARVIASHPELCEMDRRLLEERTGLPVTCLQRYNPSTRRGTCIFQVILQPETPANVVPAGMCFDDPGDPAAPVEGQ